MRWCSPRFIVPLALAASLSRRLRRWATSSGRPWTGSVARGFRLEGSVQRRGEPSLIESSRVRRCRSNHQSVFVLVSSRARCRYLLWRRTPLPQSWNPGQLVKQMIAMGSPSQAAAEHAWADIHGALSVTGDDDVWARWLQSEFEPRRTNGIHWEPRPLDLVERLPELDRKAIAYPAKQFVIDILGVISAKSSMTRRQWITLLEALLRIGTVSHVLWLCDVNDRIWRLSRAALAGQDEAIPNGPDATRRDVLSVKRRMLSYGNPAIPTIRDFASRYLSARLGINRMLWALQGLEAAPTRLSSSEEIHAFLLSVRKNRVELNRAGVIESFNALQDREVRTIGCKKGLAQTCSSSANTRWGSGRRWIQPFAAMTKAISFGRRGRQGIRPGFFRSGPRRCWRWSIAVYMLSTGRGPCRGSRSTWEATGSSSICMESTIVVLESSSGCWDWS